MKRFELLDYEAVVSYNKEHYCSFKVTLINTIESKVVFCGEHVTIDQLCFNIHREMLLHHYHAYNPTLTLYAIERMRDGLDLWLDKLGELNV